MRTSRTRFSTHVLALFIAAAVVACADARRLPTNTISTVRPSNTQLLEDCLGNDWYMNYDPFFTCQRALTESEQGGVWSAILGVGAGMGDNNPYYSQCVSIRSTLIDMLNSGRLRIWQGIDSRGNQGQTRFGGAPISGVQPPYVGSTNLWVHEGVHAWLNNGDEDTANFYQNVCS